MFLYKNKQYQWLLSEAYEAFKYYLECMYECSGYLDPNFWNPKDFDGQDPSSAKRNGPEWFIERLKKKKNTLQSILNHFRSEFPALGKMEKNNKINVNLRLSICLIEKLRHIIVHKHGKTDIRSQVIENILKASCLLKNTKLEPEARARISDYLGTGEYEGLVILIENLCFIAVGFPWTLIGMTI